MFIGFWRLLGHLLLGPDFGGRADFAAHLRIH